MSDYVPPLSQGVGYGVVVGVGALFAVGMVLTTCVLRRYRKEIITAEEFATAGRSVKPGLIASAVVSSWTWAATLLQSTSMAYKVGVSGPFYYAAGACVQIILFSLLAIKSKQRAPNAHTFLEIIKTRYGTGPHILHMMYALATNVLVTAMLLSGGSTVVSSLTGMNPVAACFLLPVGVIVYTLFGGIRATFLTDYVHTVIIVTIIMLFSFTVYCSGDILGSIATVYDLLKDAAHRHPVEGNHSGEYLTLRSKSGLIFFIISLVGNFGTVFLDNGYFTKAFSSSPAAALPGYILGGLSWFAIPCLIATSMGLACVAVEGMQIFPTYPNRLSAEQINDGSVLPMAAVALLGKGGALAALIMVFMAVTSAMSAELIAVSTIYTYDIHRSYIDPCASGKKLISTSHLACVVFGIVMSAISVGLHQAKISLGYLYEVMGIVISSAVLPSALTLFWNKQNIYAVTISPVLGTLLAITSWLGCAKSLYGEVTVKTTYYDTPMLTGNVVALLSPAVFIPILTFTFKPQNFDWLNLRENIQLVQEVDEHLQKEKNKVSEVKTDELISTVDSVQSANSSGGSLQYIPGSNSNTVDSTTSLFQREQQLLNKAGNQAVYFCFFFFIFFVILIPVPMYASGYIFSREFFTAWICILFAWIFFTAFTVCIYPLWEGRESIYVSLHGIYKDLSSRVCKLCE